MRVCGRCKEKKSLDEFAWRRKAHGQRDNSCRACRTAYKHEHYARNKQRYIDSARRRTERIVAERIVYLVSFFREHPCADCGEGDPLVLEFDHLREKQFGIGKGLRDRPWKDVLAEIEKCDVVCATAIGAGQIVEEASSAPWCLPIRQTTDRVGNRRPPFLLHF